MDTPKVAGFPLDAYPNAKDLPSNVAPMWEGKMTARVFRDALFKNLLGHVDFGDREVNETASGIRFTDLWRRECAQRFPRTVFEFSVEPGDGMTLVNLTDNHPRQDEVMTTAMRIGHEQAARWQEWVVFVGTNEERLMLNYFGEPIGVTPEMVDGPTNSEF
jgi:hypothetical protein